MKKSALSVDALHRVLSYDPATGVFRWLAPQSNRVAAGAEAGVVADNGRRYISVLGEKHSAHRLAWFYTHGVWPLANLSPINGDHADVRIANLREMTAAETAQSGSLRSTNTSGVKGVSWSKDKRKWLATITRDGKRAHLGYFDTIEAASEAYKAATIALPDKTMADVPSAEAIAVRRRLLKLWRKMMSSSTPVLAWRSFELFREDIGSVPGPNYTITAIDVTQPIGPGNFNLVAPPEPGTNAEWCRTDRRANPDKYRGKDLERRFGIDMAEYQRMFVEQKGVCAICEQPETEMRGGNVKWLAVDHDHVTGAVRGLLCHACNKAFGLMKESIEVFEKAIAYAKKHARPDNVVQLRPGGEKDT